MKTKFTILSAILLAALMLFSACITGKGDIKETDTDTETATITETEETETEAGIPTKPDLPELDSYQGMTPDVPYTLQFQSNGDGTCVVSRITTNLLYEGTYIIEIPETSPDGDTVVGVFPLKATYNLPRYLTVEDYEILDGWIEDYVNKGIEQGLYENDFRLQQFRAYYTLRSVALTPSEHQNSLLAQHPLCLAGAMYTLDPAITETEYINLSQLMTVAAPWYTADWCYADLLSLKSTADSLGIEDGYLEGCIAEHSNHFGNAEAVRIPQTVMQLEECTTTFSYLGASLIIYNGTVEQFKAIANTEIPAKGPLTVQCTDGEQVFEVDEPRYPALAE